MPVSAIIITLALIFYTMATWRERFAGLLNIEHLLLFWIGLAFDSVGTSLMIINSNAENLNLHSLTGYVGIILMIIHTIWASIVIARNNQKSRLHFHKFSIVVWICWVFSYINGVFLGITH